MHLDTFGYKILLTWMPRDASLDYLVILRFQISLFGYLGKLDIIICIRLKCNLQGIFIQLNSNNSKLNKFRSDWSIWRASIAFRDIAILFS